MAKSELTPPLQCQQLIEHGLPQEEASHITEKINHYFSTLSRELAWQFISKQILTPEHVFELHRYLFGVAYPDWQDHPETAPAWIPSPDFIQNTNLAQFMASLSINQLSDFHAWTVQHYCEFWQKIITQLKIVFDHPPTEICDLRLGIESPQWLVGAKLNIAKSCFTAPPEATAIVFQDQNQHIQKMSYAALNQLSNRIANSLVAHGLAPNDAIAIIMPMTVEAVAIYLAIIKMGGVVVSIADSFSSDEIATRCRITKTKAIFTQDYLLRDTKKFPLYEKIIAAVGPMTIVLASELSTHHLLRPEDISWELFLKQNDSDITHPTDPMAHCNILFSSGTTSEPKAIPWNHTTPIKVASDAYFHHNIQAGDVLAWPTNLGWMMGPWSIFAALINQATLAIYSDSPNTRSFGQFIQNAKVTCLGLVPTLVASWHRSACMQGLDWHAIKLFSSTGECSNTEDMLFLMSLAGYKPIIEYCGGTEIGGAYITSTIIEKNYLSLFTTPAMGSNFDIIDDQGQLADKGEVAIMPPAIGLSTELFNANHHQVYFANMPSINGILSRRHGDQIQRLKHRCYRLLGRIDDTMNLSGVKISAAEIERVLVGIEGIDETAAIAISKASTGPSQLIIYVATSQVLNKNTLLPILQNRINQHLNPLFKIHDIVFIKELPKTASNKIMHRLLRTISQKSAKIN